jgi:hypothetical protein
MLDVHPPHEALHTLKGFVIHIVAIVIGLLIAVALEQSVEFLHHRHQRLQLEEQMHEMFEDNTQVIAADIERLTALHGYLADLATAIAARRHGQPVPAAPSADDPRGGIVIQFPSLAPYEAAKENGTVALLSTQRIRLYNRVALQRELLRNVYERWFEDLAAVDAFRKRFDYSFGSSVRGEIDLAALSPAELTEYQALIGTVMSRVDWMIKRLGIFAAMGRAILDGARDDNDLARRALASPDADSNKERLPSASQ